MCTVHPHLCVSDPLLHVCLRFSACVKELWRSLVFYSPYLHICAHVYLARVQFGATGKFIDVQYVCTYSDTFKTHRQEATRRELWWVTNRLRSIYMCCTSMHVLWSQDILAGQTLMKTVLNGPGERYYINAVYTINSTQLFQSKRATSSVTILLEIAPPSIWIATKYESCFSGGHTSLSLVYASQIF